MLQPGDKIPDFELTRIDREKFTQDDLAGKRALVCFYPAAFSGVCTHEFSEFQERIDDFKSRGVEIFAISVDGLNAQRVFQEHLGAFDITFLADFEPKGKVAKAFDSYFDGPGIAHRSVALVEDGTVKWSLQMPTPAEQPTADEVLAAIDANS